MTYTGPERRESNVEISGLKMELAQVRQSLSAATEDLVTQESLNRTARTAARRLGAALVIAALVVGITGSLLWANMNRTAEVARRIESCTISTGACYKELQKSGSGGAIRLVNYMDCIFLTEPFPGRNQVDLDTCKRKVGFPVQEAR